MIMREGTKGVVCIREKEREGNGVAWICQIMRKLRVKRCLFCEKKVKGIQRGMIWTESRGGC